MAFKADPFPLIGADSLPSSGCSAARNTPFSWLLFVWESCYKLLASQWAWRKDLYTSSHLAWNKLGSSFTWGKTAFCDLLPPELPLFGLHRVSLSALGTLGHLCWGSRRLGLCWARASCLFITGTKSTFLSQWPSSQGWLGHGSTQGQLPHGWHFLGLPWVRRKIESWNDLRKGP